ncbi:MAG TPA: alpha-2-macroglobulin, partial [Dehalococcoidia bacterium]|nr:alpha-2-macroglobulin [Dehalococcoidia bacterium]
ASETDMTVTVRAGDVTKEVRITPENFDVTQLIEVPAGAPMTIEAQGSGQGVYQAVTRYNLPAAEEEQNIFDITVDFDTTNVAVNDTVGVDVSVKFNPPVDPLDDVRSPVKAGMVVLDIAVPTGFAPVTETLDALVAGNPKVKRYDVAGRKVILYIEDMTAGETINFSFDVQAQYPVRAKGAPSQAYSYYTPEWRGETIGQDVTVR